jgi:hypothetical protein
MVYHEGDSADDGLTDGEEILDDVGMSGDEDGDSGGALTLSTNARKDQPTLFPIEELKGPEHLDEDNAVNLSMILANQIMLGTFCNSLLTQLFSQRGSGGRDGQLVSQSTFHAGETRAKTRDYGKSMFDLIITTKGVAGIFVVCHDAKSRKLYLRDHVYKAMKIDPEAADESSIRAVLP